MMRPRTLCSSPAYSLLLTDAHDTLCDCEQILMKALMQLPETDFMLCLYLLPVVVQKDAQVHVWVWVCMCKSLVAHKHTHYV